MRRLVLAALVGLAVAGGARPAVAGRNISAEPMCAARGTRPPPTVDLYSFGIGPLVFEKFGHSMLCLTYPGDPTLCFNYGITDFRDPAKVIWGFLRSNAKFWVDGEPLESMLAFYASPDLREYRMIPDGLQVPTIRLDDGRRAAGFCLQGYAGASECRSGRGYAEDRSIWRQRLPLSADQARLVADRLCHDIQPENRYYVYHHFYDNCTTRLRDLLDEVFDGRLRAGSDAPHPLTFRQFGASGLAEYEALIAVSDFVTGRALDHRPSRWEAMFHPDELRAAVETRLGVPAEVIYERKGPPFPTDGPSGRWVVVAIALLCTAPLALTRWLGRDDRFARVLATLPLVLMGLLVWAVSVLVSIDWIRWNEVLLLFWPTDVLLLALAPPRRRAYARARVAGIAAVSLLAAVGVLRQPLWVPALTAFLPLALLAFELPRRRTPAGAPTAPAPMT